MADAENPRRPLADGIREDTIGELFGRLVDDAERFVRAEIRLYRAQALDRLETFKWLFAMGAIGSVFALCSVVLFLIALVFVIAPHTGPAWAAAIVAGGSLVLAAILFGVVLSKIRKGLLDRDEGDNVT